ncbi:MAG: 3-deoxy-D-manno-octulosonic acid kinase [Syntrophorhabdus sp. PtaU1.Bin050]|nr:MAG: 3-deoxy-D-manno-octulosonic acid kinase [Syntrophorhabdus sp. PtaU1.Bin050]
MAVIKKQWGRFTLFYYSSFVDPASLVRWLSDSQIVAGKGRGGIRLIETEGPRLAVRKYLHGGLFRALTRDLFLNQGRVTAEAEVLVYLRDKGFPVVAPFAGIVEKLPFFRKLYLVTVFEEDVISFLEYLQQSGRRQKLRIVQKLARLMWQLEKEGVYHPDLHLRNVLVTKENELILLDFDRARRKTINPGDMRRMFRRLGRFTEKMERRGQLTVGRMEKALFLRTYARLSGVDMARTMEAEEKTRGYLHRAGWFMESVLYGARQ